MAGSQNMNGPTLLNELGISKTRLATELGLNPVSVWRWGSDRFPVYALSYLSERLARERADKMVELLIYKVKQLEGGLDAKNCQDPVH